MRNMFKLNCGTEARLMVSRVRIWDQSQMLVNSAEVIINQTHKVNEAHENHSLTLKGKVR